MKFFKRLNFAVDGKTFLRILHIDSILILICWLLSNIFHMRAQSTIFEEVDLIPKNLSYLFRGCITIFVTIGGLIIILGVVFCIRQLRSERRDYTDTQKKEMSQLMAELLFDGLCIALYFIYKFF